MFHANFCYEFLSKNIQVYDIINKIDDDTGHLDFQVNFYQTDVLLLVKLWPFFSFFQYLNFLFFLLELDLHHHHCLHHQEFTYIMTELSKDNDQESSYKEAFRSLPWWCQIIWN